MLTQYAQQPDVLVTCRSGHVLDQANTYHHARGRQCRTCRRLRVAEWRARNPERMREQRRSWTAANRERDSEASRRWRQENPDAARRQSREKRRRVRAAGEVTPALRAVVFAQWGQACLACGTTEDIQLDHVTPIVRGGLTVESNLQPLCAPCNAAKYTKTIDYRPIPSGAPTS